MLNPPGSFSRQQVLEFLRWLYARKMMPGSLDSEIEELVYRIPRMTVPQIREYSYLMLPSGRAGHVTMVLNPPEWVRGYALLVWLLRSIDRP